jgi:hypothetical protein
MADSGQVPVQPKSALFNKKPSTIYKRHQILITELEIWTASTDFSRRTSWWAREDPGRARTWKSMKNMHFSEMSTNSKSMKLGAS